MTCSVLVAIGFERTVHAHANIVGLLSGQLGYDATKTLHHEGCNLLVELLRQDFNTDGILSGIAFFCMGGGVGIG